MKVYLAARYGRRAELASYALLLEQHGFASVTSRWLAGHEDGNYDTITPEGSALCAQEDLEDIWSADAVVVFTGGNTRGGYHVEFGLALAMNKKVVLIGERENVFHYLDRVHRFATFNDFLYMLEIEKGLARLLGAA